jgi:hypothetical protein
MLTDKDLEMLLAERHADYLSGAIDYLRNLLKQLGRAEFRAYGYAKQLRQYRCQLRFA